MSGFPRTTHRCAERLFASPRRIALDDVSLRLSPPCPTIFLAQTIDQAMSRWQDQPRDRHESVTIRTIWLTLALSLLIHISALLVLIPHLQTVAEEQEQGEASAPVQVQLTPPPSAAVPATPEPSRDTQAAIAPPHWSRAIRWPCAGCWWK